MAALEIVFPGNNVDARPFAGIETGALISCYCRIAGAVSLMTIEFKTRATLSTHAIANVDDTSRRHS